MKGAVAVGCVWGVLCAFANLVPVASTIAQMAIPWVWVGAFVGHRTTGGPRPAALSGAVALAAANLTYFVVGAVGNGVTGSSVFSGVRFLVVWTLVGLVAGPIAGVIGHWLTTRRSPMALTALAAGSMAEPLASWAHIDHVDAHSAYVTVAAVGLFIPAVWRRAVPRSAFVVAGVALVFTYPIAVGLEAAMSALDQISPPMRLL